MTVDQFFAEYRVLLGALAAMAAINVPLAHRELVKLKNGRPDLLKAVGIAELNWWLRCTWGVIRLGYGPKGRELSRYTRLVFMGVGFYNAWLLVLLLLVAFGVLEVRR